jgi:hypothetical protein
LKKNEAIFKIQMAETCDLVKKGFENKAETGF